MQGGGQYGNGGETDFIGPNMFSLQELEGGEGSDMNTATIENRIYYYKGNAGSFELKVSDINNDSKASTVRDASININGNQLTGYGLCCLVVTLIFGCILIFPLFFLCCDWWRKKVYPTFSIPESTYLALQNVIKLPTLRNLTLTINDNNFTQQKANIIYNMVSQKGLRSFTFINLAAMFDLEEDEYSGFEERMKKFKTLKAMTDIKWQHDVVK